LNHLDVYRLETVAEAEDLGLGELLEDGITLIEWGDTIAGALPADYLELRFAFGEGDDDRELDVQIVGPSWSARQRALRSGLERWAC
jgi:tRNA threonylcarbamoyladenosine biosynthesis protein TsaE